jgi:hypothetical protein
MSRINKERVVFLSIIIFLVLNLTRTYFSLNSGKRAYEEALRVEATKSGKLQFEKDVLVLSEKDLKEKNDSLYNEVKDQKGQVIFITDVRTVIETDTQYLTNTLIEYPDASFGLKWGYDTTFSPGNYRSLAGESKFRVTQTGVSPLSTEVTKDVMGMKFYTGIKEREGQIEIFVRSDYPGFSVSSIEGALIDPRKSEVIRSHFPPKKWGLGAQVGGTMNREGKIVPYIGVGLSYNFIRF